MTQHYENDFKDLTDTIKGFSAKLKKIVEQKISQDLDEYATESEVKHQIKRCVARLVCYLKTMDIDIDKF